MRIFVIVRIFLEWIIRKDWFNQEMLVSPLCIVCIISEESIVCTSQLSIGQIVILSNFVEVVWLKSYREFIL